MTGINSSWQTNKRSLQQERSNSKSASVLLLIIALILITAMITDNFFIGTLILLVPGVLCLIAASPVRILLLVFILHLLIPVGRLRQASLMGMRSDEFLLLMIFGLWVLSLPDRSMKNIRIGKQGYFIIAFLILFAISAYRGISMGRSGASIVEQFRTFGGYFMYFPLLWILNDEKNVRWIWKTLLASSFIGAIILLGKGYFGYGSSLIIRQTTGLRIVARQQNAYAAVMLMYIGRIWKKSNRKSVLLFAVPVITVVSGSIIISQTRGLWYGVLVGLASAWLLNLFRKKDQIKLGRKLIVSLTALSIVVILAVFSVSVLGILSTSDMSRRTGTDTGSYLTDVSTLSRLVAWSAILEELRGTAIVTGKGAGALYTCYRPDIGAVVTLFYVDSSYFQIALVMGLIGVILLLGIFVTTLIRAARLFLSTDNEKRAGIALGVFASVVMLLFASIFASVLTGYRFTTSLWMFIPALLQSEILREERENGLQKEPV